MSKKYRLIKEYPGSPKLGTMGEVINKTVMYTETDNDVPYYSTKYINFKKYPEYWEEIVEKDYQILSFYAKNISGKGDDFVDPNYIWYETFKGNGKWSRKGHITAPYSTQEITNHNGYGIHSVKRLSDGEVFTVGDKIKGYDNDNGFIISHIWIGSSNDLVLANYPKNAKGFNRSCFIKGAIKVKTPLFTTEDGVDVYEGDKVFGIDRNWKVFEFNALCKIDNELFKRFSTKEAAEEYVLMNKLCLSINEVMNITYNPTETFTSTSNKLKELVKSKI